MTRTLVVWWPDWSVAAAVVAMGLDAEQPVAIVQANRVTAASVAARRDDVVPGLRRREAQSRCPDLVVIDHDPGRDARAFEPVVAALDALTPRIEITEPGMCTFATRGPSRYFGGDHALAVRAAALVADARRDLIPVGGAPAVGIADGPFVAALAARLASGFDPPVRVVPPGGSASFAAPLPCAVLGPSARDLVDLLARLGLPTLGDFAALPEAEVAARFATAGVRAHRLASGLDERPLAAEHPPIELAVTALVDPPAERVDQLAFLAKALADQLHDALGSRGLACTRVGIELETEHGERHVRLWRHEGVLDAVALAERARWQLDGWLGSSNRPTAGVTLLRLVPDEVVPDDGVQLGFWGGRTLADERAARALARIQDLLGFDAVCRPERAGGRGPGDQVRATPLLGLGDMGHTGGASAAAGRSPAPPWPGRLPAPAPAIVHHERVGAEVLDAQGGAVGVDGRGEISAVPTYVAVDGGRPVEVLRWAGPWPLEERWWDPPARRRRARLQVVVAPGTALLLALEGGRWWVEAIYD